MQSIDLSIVRSAARRVAGFSPALSAVALLLPVGVGAQPRHASSFSGSCHLAGTVKFQPGLTANPQPLTQRARATGTCSGTFVDRRGRSHELSDSPVTYIATEQAESASCAGGTDQGTGKLVFPYGTIRFTISETRVGVGVVASLSGARGGSATAVARPSPNENPVTAVQSCAGAGIDQAQIEADAQARGLSG